ncbi:MAG TPA: hypothetical protein VHN99_04350 [Deinococcales bacterium]|nr:hypothetical protein [Deinococcales bacterium]
MASARPSFDPPAEPGRVILLNGASSAGKSTLGRAIQAGADRPFLRFSPDLILFGGQVLPARRQPEGPFSWREMRPKVFEGYWRCLPALAGAGNDLIADLVLETPGQLRRLVEVLHGLDVFFVGVHCPLPELERRERQRGDRGTGDARRDFETTHTFAPYDLEVDSTRPAELVAAAVLRAWRERERPSVFERLAATL